jgi:hypothetical protein
VGLRWTIELAGGAAAIGGFRTPMIQRRHQIHKGQCKFSAIDTTVHQPAINQADSTADGDLRSAVIGGGDCEFVPLLAAYRPSGIMIHQKKVANETHLRRSVDPPRVRTP